MDDRYMGRFRKPARYINGERNVNPRVNPETARLKIGLVFPDLYEIGMSNLGHKILYHILGTRSDILVDRCYAVTRDVEQFLKSKQLPLTSLEYGIPLNRFDIIGITLPYELCYTSMLSVLELGQIPIIAGEREKNDPLVIGGGFCSFNPEPVAEFFDCICIGEGEEIILELVDHCISMGRPDDREKALASFLDIPGVYVPSFYNQAETASGNGYVRPAGDHVPATIPKRIIDDLDSVYFPDSPIVPIIKTVHDRVVVEVSRGCCGQCRFCQAGNLYLPTRERSVETILRIIRENIRNTGYEEVSLASLHTAAYSQLHELSKALLTVYTQTNVSFSFPSLRPDILTDEIIRLNKTGKKSGFTLAPEAGTERLRNVINKPVNEDAFLEGVANIFSQGWKLVKLYFMIGLPTETEDDLLGIIDLTMKTLKLGKMIHKNSCTVNVSISSFVPKPFTPFQWIPMDEKATLLEKQRFLRNRLRNSQIKLSWHNVEQSVLEELFARGDRSLSNLVMEAYRKGCRLDGWTDEFQPYLWYEVLKETGINSSFTSGKIPPVSDPLPWDHIGSGLNKKYLREEYENAHNGIAHPKCVRKACADMPLPCIAQTRKKDLPALNEREMIAYPKTFGDMNKTSGQFKIRCTFNKLNRIRFLSQLDTSRIILLALNCADIPLKYSEGFNPKPKVSFFQPLPVGTGSMEEHMELEVTHKIPVEECIKILNQVLPDNLQITSMHYLEPFEKPLQEIFTAAHYTITCPGELISPRIPSGNSAEEHVPEMINEFLSQSAIPMEKIRKNKSKTIDIRSFIKRFELDQILSDTFTFKLDLFIDMTGSVRPEEVFAIFLDLPATDTWQFQVLRTIFS